MMYTEPIIEQLFHLLVLRHPYLSSKEIELRMCTRIEVDRIAFHLGHFLEFFCCFDGVFSGVNENHDLMALVDVFGDLCVGWKLAQLFVDGRRRAVDLPCRTQPDPCSFLTCRF